MKKKIFVAVGSIVLVIVLAGAFLNFLVDAAIDRTYATYQVSYSIADAKKSKMFVLQPKLEQQTITLNEFEFTVQEVWIEQATDVKYEYIFFRKRFPIGNRLMVTIKVPYDSLAHKNLRKNGSGQIVVNNAIRLTSVVPFGSPDTWLFYREIKEPFPASVKLSFW